MLLTRTKTGDALVSTEDAADFLKVTETDEHPLIESLVKTATLHCEQYTARDVRANEYELLLDGFGCEADGALVLKVSGVDSVSDVSHLVSGTFTTIVDTTYYLKNGLIESRVQLFRTTVWPSNSDDQDHNVRVQFATKPHKDVALCRDGILRHLALLYADRGDMEPPKAEGGMGGAGRTLSTSTAKQSGAEQIYASVALHWT